MDISLASAVVSWFLQIGPACIVCTWDPLTQSWVPYGSAAAAGGALGLSDLFGPTFGGAAGGAPAGGTDAGTSPSGQAAPPDDGISGASGRQVEPIDPHALQAMDPDARAVAEERDAQRRRDDYRLDNPGATTAPPPQPTAGERLDNAAADYFYHTFFRLGH